MPKALENGLQNILQNAKEVLKETGYEKFSMRKVADASQIAVGTIYNYFSTKDDLLIALMEEYWKGIHFEHKKILENGKMDKYEKLKSIFFQLEEFILTFNSVWIDDNIKKVDKEKGHKRYEAIEELITLIETLLIDDLNDKIIVEGIESRDIAEFIVSNFTSIIIAKQIEYSVFEKILKKLLETNN